ncbi:hypothetical protein ALC62_04740 [Cyphomyrmex costatus]|uniref:Uncharacterized protein n=1 Tax=Cyphomyrmex costatus TaxID=456900 RepID=A0A195CTF0_9HYME|nr:hypothetical protein ALC62_04740 [Cyphomyrmex costatus]
MYREKTTAATRTRSRTRSSHDSRFSTLAITPWEFGSTENRIESIRETIHSSNVTRTGLATAVNVGFPTLCCVDRTTPRENQPPVYLFAETKGNARSSLIQTIDLLRRKRVGSIPCILHLFYVVCERWALA